MTTAPFRDVALWLESPKNPVILAPESKETTGEALADASEMEYDPFVPIPSTSRVPHRATMTVFVAVVGIVTAYLRATGRGMTTEELLAFFALAGVYVGSSTIRPDMMAPASKAKPIAKDK